MPFGRTVQPGSSCWIAYCKSRIFRMHVIFVYFVRGGFRTKIKGMQKVQSKTENLQWSATVRKFHAYERSESPEYENGVRTKYSGFTVCPIKKMHSVLPTCYVLKQPCTEEAVALSRSFSDSGILQDKMDEKQLFLCG